MTPIQILFLIVAAIVLVCAFVVVSTRRVMHSALWLVLALFNIAVLFAMLESGFFAVVQVVVYVGAIAILIIFAVMLTRRVMQDVGPQVIKGWWLPAVLCLLLFVGLVVMMSTWEHFNMQPPVLSESANDISALGLALVSPDQFMIPFEVASVLLLGALVGAVYVAVERKERQR